MANLLVVTFKRQGDARSAMTDLMDLETDHAAAIQDIEIVECDAEGKRHRISTVDQTTKGAIVGGGLLGLLMGLLFFPVLGLAIGAIAGGAVGKSIGNSIDQKLVKDVEADLTPETSALFALLTGNGAAMASVFRKYEYKVYLTSLDPELEEQLLRSSEARSAD